MLQHCAEKLANICCKRNWVDAQLYEWCVYAIVKWIGLLLFFSTVFLWMSISGRYVETLSFLIPFYMLRRRIGGCHANKAYVCFFISVGLVILVSSYIGQLLMKLTTDMLVAINVAVVFTAMLLAPVYPPQVKFDECEKAENCKKKNLLLLIILFGEIISVVFLGNKVLAHSLCGIFLAIVTVIIQKNLKEETSNEKN